MIGRLCFNEYNMMLIYNNEINEGNYSITVKLKHTVGIRFGLDLLTCLDNVCKYVKHFYYDRTK